MFGLSEEKVMQTLQKIGPVLKVVYWLFLVYFPSSLHQLLGNILDIPSEVGLTG